MAPLYMRKMMDGCMDGWMSSGMVICEAVADRFVVLMVGVVFKEGGEEQTLQERRHGAALTVQEEEPAKSSLQHEKAEQ